MRPVQSLPLSSIAVATPMVLDYRLVPFSAGMEVVVSAGATLSCKAEYTLDDVFSATFNPATANWIPVVGLSAVTTTTVVAVTAPAIAVRLNMTAWTVGNAYLRVVQNGM